MTGVWGLRKFFQENKILLYFEIELKPMLGDLDLIKHRIKNIFIYFWGINF